MVSVTTRLEESSAQPIHFKRVIQKGELHYFLQLYLEGSALPFHKGATVVFTDGAKIQWTDALVESTRKGTHYNGQCEILLTEDLVDQFQEKQVALIKLSSCERVLTPTQTQGVAYLINCVLFADLFDGKSNEVVSH